ncbi:MAG: hypothetical protein A3B74_02870 [Candidatus Kerfeldbacteria bacterium RIFCSPHIGHO2_02_FULL_42_14]|uniref:DUF5673 domain-containing protein n=1 Tax=Candidatus Kerfeldbacteria bacterium RIFCSPHIGHO2_02_FULL_42_14 TaxID=1798540 RepID=A0A1G2AS08_9BACT|nr:MAG: hypothetical protein A3B74_02870 [Candidatus Kerfeldbacteria bacterium RIFCSPHIGHO2_02_FULL_42_14]OGY81115.1 MAG: hypothetical protein A3E60_02170 [Candidatus Kerfeldbacteria bacterium RIFCSPHIGHO2_12_FULL_42_13]OGY83910.1 MAG: hypothetical protein A3I91_05010 [Candidatus Kerfeldbacteria bacterium RIFCSPLOWO2_02_FULL_42_19]OGY86551.1 MAG: hypothetical protein A3G01_04820 [Candidatus Kerfeldbacteria bacterium RIFCSPLOWO2_12_FULL_43_9]
MPKTKQNQTIQPKGSKQDQEHGTVYAEWQFPEFSQHERSLGWYITGAVIAAAFFIYALATDNYLFAVSILIFIIIIFFQHKREPLPIACRIMEDGLAVDQKFLHYKNLKNFWIIYNPPAVKRLYLNFENGWKPEVSIPLENQNPLYIRNILLQYLREDAEKTEESLYDSLSRQLKL